MEESERKLIRENLTELTDLTVCNTGLLTTLEEKGILGKDDVEKLCLPGKTSSEKAKEMYDVIITRKNGFKNLLDALEKTQQSGVLHVLTSGREPSLNEINELTYDKTKVLGTGSYGYVYRGKFGSRFVAVKVVHPNNLPGPAGAQQVLNEVKILQHCDMHENVVRYFGTKQIEGNILIVLELCDVSLREWVSDKKVERHILPVEVLRQATAGLAWLHSQEIIHRDLKPENILLILNLKRVKLADFGLSRRVLNGNSFVATRNIGGTPGWMAPEILSYAAEENQNMCEFTFASDVFSLGCVYYYVLTDGKSAFGDAVRCQGNILDGKSMMKHDHINHGCSQNILFINTMVSPDPKSRPNCKTLLGLPLFWSEYKRAAFLEKMIDKESTQLENLKSHDSCKFDHSGEIKVLEKMGYESTRCRCIIAFLLVECSKRGFSISNISEETPVVLESKKETVIKSRTVINKSEGKLTSEVETVGKSPALNVVKHPDSVGVNVYAASHKLTTHLVNSRSVSQIKKIFENKLEDNLKRKNVVLQSKLKNSTNINPRRFELPHSLNVSQIQKKEVKKKDDKDAQIDLPKLTTRSIQNIYSGNYGEIDDDEKIRVESFGNKLAQQGNAEKVTPAEQNTGEKVGEIVNELKRLDFKLQTNQDRLFQIVEYENLDIVKRAFEFAAGQLEITEIWKEEQGDIFLSPYQTEAVTIQISLLHAAVRRRRYDVVEYLVNEQAFGNVLDKHIFRNLLYLECTWTTIKSDAEQFDEKCRILQLLCKKCPSLTEFKDKFQRTPLHSAMGMQFSDGKHVEFITMLLRTNAFVNGKDIYDRTPLHLFVCSNFSENIVDIIRLLIAHGADPDMKDRFGMTFLNIAAEYVPPPIFPEIMLYLVSIQRTHSFNIPDNDGWTVLHRAVTNKKGDPLENTLQLLKTHDFNFNALRNDGDSAMFEAIKIGRSESSLNTLIRFGADWTIMNKKNETALHQAAFYKKLHALKMFIRLNCDVNSKNVEGETPLHQAINPIGFDTYDVINELLINGADLGLKNNKGESPINIAKYKFTLQEIDQRTLDLLLKGSSVNLN